MKPTNMQNVLNHGINHSLLFSLFICVLEHNVFNFAQGIHYETHADILIHTKTRIAFANITGTHPGHAGYVS